MTDRVGAVGAAREQGDGEASDGQRGAVGGAVDPVRRTRHDRHSPAGEVGGDLDRDMLAVRCRRPSPDHRHRRPEATERPDIAAHPEAHRGVRAQVVELVRPVRIGRSDEANALVPGDLERGRQRIGGHSGLPPLPRFGELPQREPAQLIARWPGEQRAQRPLGTESLDQPTGDAVAGLDEMAPDRSRPPIDDRLVAQLVDADDAGELLPGMPSGQIQCLHCVIPFFRYSARPMSWAPSRSLPAMSAIDHATRSTRS